MSSSWNTYNKGAKFLSAQFENAANAKKVLQDAASDIKDLSDKIRISHENAITNVAEPSIDILNNKVDEIITELEGLSIDLSSIASSLKSSIGTVKTTQTNLMKKLGG